MIYDTMDLDDVPGPPLEWSQKCACGKRFYQPNSFTNHINSCSRYKKGVESSLQEAKQRYKERKAQSKKGKAVLSSWFGDDDLDVDRSLPRPGPSQATIRREENISDLRLNPEGVAAPMEVDAETSPEPEPVQLGRGFRKHQPTKRFKDFTATSTIPFHIPSIPAEDLDDNDESPPADNAGSHGGDAGYASSVPFGPETEPVACRRTVLDDASWRNTPKNSFGLYKRYWTLESTPHDPDSYITNEEIQDVVDHPTLAEIDLSKELYPFPNMNSFRLGEWYWNDRNEKSRDSFRDLIGIITSADFNPDDIRIAEWDKINTSLASSEFDEHTKTPLDWMGDGTSWHTTTIQLDVPLNSTSLQPGLHHFDVPDFRYRPLVPAITERLKDVARGEQFHIVPTDLHWQPLEGGPDFRVYGELYNSPAFINAFKEVQNLPPEPTESTLPRYVVALMFASDETMLTSFGSTKLWPVYMLYGNESKYRRAKPSLKLFEEVAYFQSLPDHFQDWYLGLSGKKNVGDPLYTHLNRELFQAQWRTLLDDDFVHAYQHGIVVDCFDGIRRRFYPRVLTYSADYPERASVVSIRNNGDHPCPRCLVCDTDIHNMGTTADRMTRAQDHRKDDDDRKKKIDEARKIIYTECLSVNTNRVEALLKPTSLVPTKNAFSDRLSSFGLDIYRMVAVDVLHEVEIGVWKSLFIHLLRLLEAIDKSKLNVLNARFRQVPGFGSDTIRRFSNNVSEMKQFAARNYEDLLQCAIPVFEGLFPDPHDEQVVGLLFVFAYWHSLVKLRLHTDQTLDMLDNLTTILGNECRKFSAGTCNAFATHELAREYQARKRNDARKKSKRKTRRQTSNVEAANDQDSDTGRRAKFWNINTPKFHSLGDVSTYIKMFGTTDSYSTQLSEHFHRFPKSRYKRTNKRRTPFQISHIQTRQQRIRKLRKTLTPAQDEGSIDAEGVSQLHYFIGKSQNHTIQLSRFLLSNSGDLAVKGFLTKLRGHILPRVVERLLQEARLSPEEYPTALPVLEGLSREDSLTDRDLSRMYFHGERIYEHAIVQFNHTTYDCRRDQDTLNPSTSRRDLMCFQEESLFADVETAEANDTSPKRFSYARLLGVYHVNVIYLGPGMLDHKQRRFDFLWVRWYRPKNPGLPESSVWSSRRLETVSLVPIADPLACGFIDPSNVVRAVHIIPRFALGKRYDPENQRNRLFSKCGHDKEDWNECYVNPFADRDMTMRFHWGLGVGHAYSHFDTPILTPDSSARAGQNISPAQLPAEDSMDIDNERPEQPAIDPVPEATAAFEEETDSDDSTYNRATRGSDDGSTSWDSSEDSEDSETVASDDDNL